jgi:DNA-binding transcriptional MerR regulator
MVLKKQVSPMLKEGKTYYSISEVCSQTSLEPHVLRYWESEFSQLRPKKNRAGNRAYRDKDIEIINYIKHLLYEEKFTIPGAKKKLSETKTPEIKTDETKAVANEQLQLDLSPPENKSIDIPEIKNELFDILKYLKK